MNILLVGEYSRLHNSLKEGLVKLGHNVTILASGDGFKNYPVDIRIKNSFNSSIKLFFKKIIHKLTGIDISANAVRKSFFNQSDKLKGFDVVQLINESPFLTSPKIEQEIFNFLKSHNKKIYLLSCGTDYISVKYAFDKKYRYSILTPFFENKGSKNDFAPALKYLTKPYKDLHEYIFNNIGGVISSDIDYHIPLQNHLKYSGLIPNPINIENIGFINFKIDRKIILFHGINSKNYYKKGNDIFEEALDLLQEKHRNKIEIITVKDVPYETYINLYNQSHIVLDQVFAYDQGYNALEAMAKGKVVFTGAEQEWLEYYNLKEDTVAINALPDKNLIVQKIEWLIENPEQISIISKNARAFVEKEHNYIDSAKKYLDVWKS